MKESADIFDARAEAGDHGIVAAMFAFDSRLARDPPDGRVIKEGGFEESLEQVNQIIVALQVDQFVNENGFELRWGQAGPDRGRNQNDGPEPAEHDRRFDEEGF